MDKKNIYLSLRKASIKEFRKGEINYLVKETGLNIRTIKGLIKILDNKEKVSKKDIDNWLNPEFYTKEHMREFIKDSLLSMLIPTYYYEDAEFVKECGINSLPREFMEGDESVTAFIVVPGIKTISARAFKGCKNLIAIYYAEEIEEIEDEAFMGCTSLTSVWLPESVKKIGKRVYKDCVSIEEAYLPNEICQIKESLFENCTSLEDISFDANEIDIGYKAFKNCSSLRNINSQNKELLINDIETDSFNGCISLEKINIKSSEIGARAFSKCKSLKTINIKNKLLKIKEDAFIGCNGIRINLDNSFNHEELMSIEGKEELIPLIENI